MAKKSRTPPPPRRPVQAPMRRTGGSGAGAAGDDRRRRLLLLLGASGFVGLAVAIAVFVVFGRGSAKGGGSGVAQQMKAAGCTLKSYPSQGRTHLQSLAATPHYNSFPPTSGPHYQTPALWNQYDAPLAQVQLVHNLEHGGVVVQYGSGVSSATTDKITTWYRDDPTAMVVAPLPKLGSKIALTAWTHLALCPRFDEKAFQAFRKTYRYHGPESRFFAHSQLQPGM